MLNESVCILQLELAPSKTLPGLYTPVQDRRGNNDQVIAALKQDSKMVSLQGFVPDGSRFRVTFPAK